MIIPELAEVKRRASISNSTAEIDSANGVAGGSFRNTRGRIVGDGCEAVGAVQATRPVNGDTSRTSVSKGKVGEEKSLDITQDGAGALLCQEYNLSMRARAPLNTSYVHH